MFLLYFVKIILLVCESLAFSLVCDWSNVAHICNVKPVNKDQPVY